MIAYLIHPASSVFSRTSTYAPMYLESRSEMAPQSRATTASYSSSSSSSSLRQHLSPPTLADIQILHLRSSSPETDDASSAQTTSTMAAPMSSSASVDGDVDEAEEGEEGEEEEDDDADFQSHYSLDAAPLSSASSSSSSSSDSDYDNNKNNKNNNNNNNNDNEGGPSGGGGGGGGGGDHQRPTPFLSHSSSFSNSFAPPFYNRPPTPLPPSPSLTSLLRPSFSATTNTTSSRPTTPDLSSDNDTPNDDTEAAVAKSARIATRVPRASPKVPTYEYYGFVLYLLSSLAFRTSNFYFFFAPLSPSPPRPHSSRFFLFLFLFFLWSVKDFFRKKLYIYIYFFTS